MEYKLFFCGFLFVTLFTGSLSHHHNGEILDWTEENFYNECEAKDSDEPISCYGDSDTCIKDRNCRFATSIRFDDDHGEFFFRVYAKRDSTNNLGYVAVGLSKDQLMGGDSIVECLRDTGSTNFYQSWSESLDNRFPRRIYNEENHGISHGRSRFIDGNILCEFYRKEKSSIKGNQFNLKDGHYILLALGQIEHGTIKYHSRKIDRVVSSKMFMGTQNSNGAFKIEISIFSISIFLILANFVLRRV